MKITYDKKVDAMYIKLRDNAVYHNTRKVTPDVLIDYTKNGSVIGVEVLSASKNIALPSAKEKIIIQSV